MPKITIARYLAAATLLATSCFANAATLFWYTSSPESYVGQGQTVSVSPSMGYGFNPSINFDRGVSFSISNYSDPIGPYLTHWDIYFAAPYGAPLQMGSYRNAMRWPFQDAAAPGLSFDGNGRGSNRSSGAFDVLEVEYDVDGSLRSFAADFIHYDEEIVSRWNIGSVRYNSDIAINTSGPRTDVPEPSPLALFATAFALGAVVTRRRSVKTNGSAASCA